MRSVLPPGCEKYPMKGYLNDTPRPSPCLLVSITYLEFYVKKGEKVLKQCELVALLDTGADESILSPRGWNYLKKELGMPCNIYEISNPMEPKNTENYVDILFSFDGGNDWYHQDRKLNPTRVLSEGNARDQDVWHPSWYNTSYLLIGRDILSLLDLTYYGPDSCFSLTDPK